MGHPHEQMLRSAYDAVSTGDFAPMVGMLSEEIHWHVDGESPLAGDYQGKTGILEFFSAIAELYDGTLAVEVADVVANDHLGIVLTNESATIDGHHLEWTSAHVYRIEGGTVAGFTAYTDDAYHAFWSATRVTPDLYASRRE
jgi:ketosteroid isomerase-like protein